MEGLPVGNALLAPNICFICEESPRGIGVVDTRRNFDPNGPTPLNGRKYLCEKCIRAAAEEIGFVPVQEITDRDAEIAVLREKLQDVVQKIAYIQEAAV